MEDSAVYIDPDMIEYSPAKERYYCTVDGGIYLLKFPPHQFPLKALRHVFLREIRIGREGDPEYFPVIVYDQPPAVKSRKSPATGGMLNEQIVVYATRHT